LSAVLFGIMRIRYHFSSLVRISFSWPEEFQALPCIPLDVVVSEVGTDVLKGRPMSPDEIEYLLRLGGELLDVKVVVQEDDPDPGIVEEEFHVILGLREQFDLSL